MAQVHNSGLFWGLERLEWLRGVDGSLRHSQLAEKIAKWFLEGVNDPFSVRRYQDSCVAPPPPLPCRAALRGTWQNRSEQYHSLEQAWRRTQKQREALLQTTVGPGRRGRGGGACRLRFGGGGWQGVRLPGSTEPWCWRFGCCLWRGNFLGGYMKFFQEACCCTSDAASQLHFSCRYVFFPNKMVSLFIKCS